MRDQSDGESNKARGRNPSSSSMTSKSWVRRSVAQSRKSVTRTTRTTTSKMGVGTEVKKVMDGNVDRTPKPLLSLGPTVLKQGLPSLGGWTDDSYTPTTDATDNFLDRMSSAAFSKGGWSSNNGSGSMTPSSEMGEEDQMYGGPGGVQGSQGGQQGEGQVGGKLYGAGEDGRRFGTEQGPEEVLVPTLTQEDLEQQVSILLTETDTVFLLSMPAVAASLDTDEGKAVITSNQRYQASLAAREASSKLADVEVQTLDLLRKAREVQSASSSTVAVSCQASGWDIADAHKEREQEAESAGAADEEAQTVQALLPGAAAAGPGSGHASAHGSSYNRGSSTWTNGAAPAPAGANGVAASMGPAGWAAVGAGEGVSVRDSSRLSSSASWTTGSIMGGSYAGNRRSSDAANNRAALECSAPVSDAAKPHPLTRLRGLLDSLQVMDAALTQNIYLPQLILYRDVKVSHDFEALAPEEAVGSDTSAAGDNDVEEDSDDGGPAPAATTSSSGSPVPDHCRPAWPIGKPGLQLLWQWSTELLYGRNVACMCWNKACPDLLAAGYGAFTFGSSAAGMVAFWSLKNPTHPLWTFDTSSGVTAMDFSARSPNVLALGMYDGTVTMLDVRTRQPITVAASTAETGKHTDPVWKVRWLNRGIEREEVLISISTDGRVVQWSIAKGLEHTDLIKLKRVPRHAAAAAAAATANGNTSHSVAAAVAAPAEQPEPFISRLTGGMSFDFNSRDCRLYAAGTEDGWIHKCSTSYSEQYLESYQGHLGPVYQLQFSPFKPDLFISCSGDWTTRLWHEGKTCPLLTLQSSNYEVNDVQWCPSNSTLCGTVTAEGRVELWDFASSTLRPLAQHKVREAGSKLSCLLFSANSPVVVCGGDTGTISVYRLHNVTHQGLTPAQQLKRLETVLNANVIKTQATQAAQA